VVVQGVFLPYFFASVTAAILRARLIAFSREAVTLFFPMM
jgi:hypothetical protein